MFLLSILVIVVSLYIGFLLNPYNAKAETKITYDNLIIKGVKKPPFKLYSILKDECFKQNAINKKSSLLTRIFYLCIEF
jgi:hypothetical protein